MSGFNSLAALWAVRDDRTLGAAEQRVLLMLIAFANESGRCSPSVYTLAAAARMRPQSVREALRNLEASSGPVRLQVERARVSRQGDPDTHEYILTPGEGWGDRERTRVKRERTVGQTGTQGVRSRSTGGRVIGNGEEEREEDPSEDETEEGVSSVLAYWDEKLWKRLHGGKSAKRTESRKTPVRARLRSFSREQLCAVVDKVAQSEFHLNGGYIEPVTIFRNDEKVEGWLAKKPEQPRRGVTQPQHGGLDDDVLARAKAAGERLMGGE